MDDCREMILSDIKRKLIVKGYDCSSINQISNIIVESFKGYHMERESTELVVQDQSSEEMLKLFTATLLTEGKSQNTLKQYIYIIRRFYQCIGKPLLEMTPMDIRIWLAQMEQQVSLRTCNNYRNYLASFYSWAKDEELIEKNPMNKIMRIKYEKVVRKAFTSVELDKMRSACQTLRERAELEVFISTGARVAEVCGLDITDVVLDNLEVTIRNGKGNKQRMAYMSEICRFHLKKYIDSRKDQNLALFISRLRSRMTENSMENDVKRIGERAGIDKVHPHRFRRNLATTLNKKGVNITSIQQILGHSNINVTLGYINTDKENVKGEVMRASV